MSNYTISVDWAGKNALSDSDAAKIISGTDFNTEFTTVQTAINSKANLNGSSSESFSVDGLTIAGTPTGPTQSAGNNTTRLATTAFVTTAANALNAAAYPIGSIFTTTVAYANSAAVVTAIGGTTWAAFGAGKVLIGLDSGDTDFDTVEETGGAKTDSHTLTTAEMPAHTHTTSGNDANDPGALIHDIDQKSGSATETHTSNSTGGGGAHTHDIVQPYIVVYFWKRTA
jgi:hypothetical protein